MNQPTFESISAAQGWDQASQLQLALDYIDNQGDNAAWIDFLQQAADAENNAPLPQDQRILADEPITEDPRPRIDSPAAQRLNPALEAILSGLRTSGINVYVYDAPQLNLSWIVIERNGNVGTMSYGFEGYQVNFAIKPNRDTGSSLLVTPLAAEHDLPTHERVLALAQRAVGTTYANFATAGEQVPNHGWKHFDWCRQRLVPLAGSDPVPSQN